MSERYRQSNRSNRGGRHPPHLKGKEIGLYYAQRHKESTQEGWTLGSVILTEKKIRQIQDVLNESYSNQSTVDTKFYKHIRDSQFKWDFLRIIHETIEEKLSRTVSNLERTPGLDEHLYGDFSKKKQSNYKYNQMLTKRKRLPSFEMKEEILDLISSNQITVISGETGCGKTTQVPQFILDDYIENRRGSLCKIVCTQPRRISAISVAERVAEERGEPLGDSVGYQIRLEKKLPQDQGSICFCTTGVIVKIMEGDPALADVSHLILDEIHERDVLSDFLLALIKQIVRRRNDLKVILMSATLNSEKFSEYFWGAPHLNIPGFTFPVTEYYLEDVIQMTGFQFESGNYHSHSARQHRKKDNYDYMSFIGPHIRQLEHEKKYSPNVLKQLKNPNCEELNLDLILALIIHICQTQREEGAILVFLTGFMEISKLSKLMDESHKFPRSRYLIFPLHSLMPTVEQKQIFETPPPGKRKIILSTNIAETSITIDDVVFVIDCGKIKMTNFDVETNTQTLSPEWVSLANADQRRGRAGRVKPGVCYHLFSQARKLLLEKYQLPEILRKRLDDVILRAKILQLGKMEQFFQRLIDCPNREAITLSLKLLKKLAALDDDENLTPLGYHLAKLPMAPQLGKMILFGAIFSCLDPVLSIAATLDFKDPFQLPLRKEEEARRKKLDLANGVKSDHLLFHEVLRKYEESAEHSRYFCWEYFLSSQTLKLLQNMKEQFMSYLFEMKFVTNSDPKSPDCNVNSDNNSLVKAIICAGLYPNVLFAKKRGQPPLYTFDFKKQKLHPKSILSNEKYFESPLLVYYLIIKSTSYFVHDATMVHLLPVIFFGDKFEHEPNSSGGYNKISINEKLRFKCNEHTALIIKELRRKFNLFLEYKIAHPGPIDWLRSYDETKILQVIMDLITWEDLGDMSVDFSDADD